jgi:hypothetical protein
MILAGTTNWADNQDPQLTFSILLGPGVRALLAAVAGILLLAPRMSREAAAGFLIGTSAAAVMGVLMAVGTSLYAGGVEYLNIGWALALAGHIVIAVTGLLAIGISAWRSPLPRGPVAWRDPVTYAVLLAAAACAILLISYAGQVTASPQGYWAAMFYLWALVTVTVAFVGLTARPSQAGRLVLLSWATAILGLALSEWVLLTLNGSESMGMPWLVTSAIVLAVAGAFIGRRDVSVASSD